ncbi:DUF3397 family protein [Latilactobacillus curvatus]|uniref:DUF3397 family protein n=1 Tax=Latilactobacillus curvatus TaxID=28038 RepID=UPI0020C7508D|nr:DUF3397 family protein [Latilactobacillus curvatus]MCP8876482.1 DUF3397 domain-containing protein [Latilactobacillus curvatus]MDT7016890.1 DUF3397 family protein [Latilactobacillus curvatus]
MPFSTTLFFAGLPPVCVALGYCIDRLTQRLFKHRFHYINWLPIPLLVSAIFLSMPIFSKAGWFFCLAICLWGIIWSLTRFYYDRALYLRKFLRSWWRFVIVMATAWYLSFLIITLL